MSKTYRAYNPDQQLLLPAALQEWGLYSPLDTHTQTTV